MSMKIAVFSDIHGNYVALQKCIDYALTEGTDIFIFLGDYLGELAYPQKTMEIIYALKQNCSCFFIRGNKEDYWNNYRANGEQGWKEFDSTTGSLYYVYSQLTSEDLSFFSSLSHTEELAFDGYPPITICHGSPQRTNEKLLSRNKNTLTIIENNISPYILCGHTHVQEKIEHNGKIVLNAGSVGVSLHGNGKAQFMILQGTPEQWRHEFISLDYDAEKVIEELHSSGLAKKAPAWCKVTEHLLRTGEISHGTVLAEAMDLCRQKNGECNWPDIPEECWEQAVGKLIGYEIPSSCEC